MTKTKKIVIGVIAALLALVILVTLAFSTVISIAFCYYMKEIVANEYLGITVAGVDVTRSNWQDVLGDGTVSYNMHTNMLTFDNASIEHDYSIIHTIKDLNVKLVGENKFVCKDGDYITAIYAADYLSNKKLSIEGDGSLVIDFQNVSKDGVGILAGDLMILTDVTLNISGCSNAITGVIAYSSLTVRYPGNLNVNVGNSSQIGAVAVRGNLILEGGTSLDVSVGEGVTEACRGVSVEGDAIIAKGAKLSVSVDDSKASIRECISVSGTLDIAADTIVNASSKQTYAVECYNSIKLGHGAAITSSRADGDTAVFCYGAIVNYGATMGGKVEALGGVHNMFIN